MTPFIMRLPLSRSQWFELRSNEPMTPRAWDTLQRYIAVQIATALEEQAESIAAYQAIADVARYLASIPTRTPEQSNDR